MIPSSQLWSLPRESWPDLEDYIGVAGKLSEDSDLLQVRIKLRNRQRFKLCKSSGPVYLPREDIHKVYESRCKRFHGIPGGVATFKRLLSADRSVMIMQRKLVKPILLQIYTSVDYSESSWLWCIKWWKLLTNVILTEKNTSGATKIWKNQCLHWRHKFFNFLSGPHAPPVRNAPVDPLVSPFPLGEGKKLTYEDFQRLSTLLTSRSLPPGDAQTTEASLLGTLSALTDEFRDTPVFHHYDEYRKVGKLVGTEVLGCAGKALYELSSHVSISNSSCIECPRSEGGKVAYTSKHFINGWMKEVVTVDTTVTLPVGVRITFHEGKARWQATIPNQPDQTMFDPADFGRVQESNSYFPTYIGCQEERIAILAFTWSYLWLLSNGFIDERGRSLSKPIPAKLSVVGEPGGKARVPTVTPCCLVLYLQPYAHSMRSILQGDPTMTAGLGAANQAYEFIKRFQKTQLLKENVMLGDLTEATNWFEWETLKTFMEGFWSSMTLQSPDGIRKEIHDYFRNAHTLILSPLEIEFRGWIVRSVRGAPMGLPGTKILLHLLAKGIEAHASKRTRPAARHILSIYPFAIAGDDVMKCTASVHELEAHKQSARYFNVIPSEDKWGVYQLGGPFCEVTMLMGGHTDLRGSQYVDPKGRHAMVVDSVRGRLLSSETKQNGDDDVNPLWGKARQLSKETSWMKPPNNDNSYFLRVSLAFLFSMREFGKGVECIAGLPIPLGGLGLRLPHAEAWKRAPVELRKAYAFLEDETADPFQQFLVKKGLNGISRPLIMIRGDRVIDKINPYYELLSEYLPTVSFQEACELEELEPSMRYWDKFKTLKRRQWCNLSEYIMSPMGNVPRWVQEVKPNKGWGFAPISMRLRNFQLRFPFLEGVPEIDLAGFNALCVKSLKPEFNEFGQQRWVKEEYLNMLMDDEVVPLNIKGTGTGHSLFLKVPTDEILYRATPKRSRIEAFEE